MDISLRFDLFGFRNVEMRNFNWATLTRSLEWLCHVFIIMIDGNLLCFWMCSLVLEIFHCSTKIEIYAKTKYKQFNDYIGFKVLCHFARFIRKFPFDIHMQHSAAIVYHAYKSN